MTAQPRVFIVDDHGLFRSGVRMELIYYAQDFRHPAEFVNPENCYSNEPDNRARSKDAAEQNRARQPADQRHTAGVPGSPFGSTYGFDVGGPQHDACP